MTIDLLRELHTAMSDIMMQRRISASAEERETAHKAIKVWRRVDAYLKAYPKGNNDGR